MARGSSWNSSSSLAPATRCAIVLRDDHTCAHCLRRLDREQITIDHIVPRARGGSSKPENLVVACGDCNGARGDHSKRYYGTFVAHLAKFERTVCQSRLECRRRVKRVLDRSAGRQLAAEWYPTAAARCRQASARYKQKRRELTASVAPCV